MPYVGQKPADIISTAVDTVTGKFSGNVDVDGTLNTQGETTLQTHLNMGDGDIIKLGASADLTIQHDGSNSFVNEGGTGHLFIGGSQVNLMNAANNEYLINAIADGAVNIYYNNSAKLSTTSSGVTVTGAITASSGDVTITDGNLVVASGHGINFAATGQAGGMTSELLSDFEEGTFDVVIRDATSGGNTGSVTQSNKYVKVGDFVWLQFNLINITTSGLTSSNVLYLTGLPFTPATGSNGVGSVATNNVNVAADCFGCNVFQNSGQSYAAFLQNKDNGGSASTTVTAVDNGTADVFGTIMIKV